jgi:hypothetical protein
MGQVEYLEEERMLFHRGTLRVKVRENSCSVFGTVVSSMGQ